jgi:hypothetical protein
MYTLNPSLPAGRIEAVTMPDVAPIVFVSIETIVQ